MKWSKNSSGGFLISYAPDVPITTSIPVILESVCYTRLAAPYFQDYACYVIECFSNGFLDYRENGFCKIFYRNKVYLAFIRNEYPDRKMKHPSSFIYMPHSADFIPLLFFISSRYISLIRSSDLTG